MQVCIRLGLEDCCDNELYECFVYDITMNPTTIVTVPSTSHVCTYIVTRKELAMREQHQTELQALLKVSKWLRLKQWVW